MRLSAHRARIMLVALAFSSACGSSSPTAPTRPTLPEAPPLGQWTGTIVDLELGRGTARLELMNVNNVVRGTWSATIGARTFEGILTEHPPGTIRPGFPWSAQFGCTPQQSGQASFQRPGSELSVVYFTSDCDLLKAGEMTLRMQ
jgi:hypothetical protein